MSGIEQKNILMDIKPLRGIIKSSRVVYDYLTQKKGYFLDKF